MKSAQKSEEEDQTLHEKEETKDAEDGLKIVVSYSCIPTCRTGSGE